MRVLNVPRRALPPVRKNKEGDEHGVPCCRDLNQDDGEVASVRVDDRCDQKWQPLRAERGHNWLQRDNGLGARQLIRVIWLLD